MTKPDFLIGTVKRPGDLPNEYLSATNKSAKKCRL